MKTNPILKDFISKDPETYERFLKLQEEPVEESPRPYTNRLEEGQEQLKQFSFRSETNT